MSTAKLICSDCGADIDPLALLVIYEKRVQNMLLIVLTAMVAMFAMTAYFSHVDTVTVLKELRK